MVPFLIGLLAIVSIFAQSGKPVSTPPHTSDEVKARGEAVSEAAQSLETGREEESGDESLVESAEVALGTKATVRIAAFNSKSGKEMPTPLPQVAVDNSVALEGSVETEDTVSEASLNVEGSSSFEFGGEVSGSQPAEAKADGKAFGQATADAAKNRGNN
jgi:hypothetical protein